MKFCFEDARTNGSASYAVHGHGRPRHRPSVLCFPLCRVRSHKDHRGVLPPLTPDPLGGREICICKLKHVCVPRPTRECLPLRRRGSQETGGGRGGGSGMFNSAPSLKECSSISNTMLLIAASEGFREPLLASSSQVSGLIFHYSERASTHLRAATERNSPRLPVHQRRLMPLAT